MRTFAVILQRLLQVGEIPVLVRTCDRAHALDVPQLSILCHELDGKQRRDIVGLFRVSLRPLRKSNRCAYQIEHDLAEQHVLEREERLRVVLLREVLERLVEVRVCGDVVLVFRVEDTGLEVELRLEVWRAVDGVGGGSCGGQRSLGGFIR